MATCVFIDTSFDLEAESLVPSGKCSSRNYFAKGATGIVISYYQRNVMRKIRGRALAYNPTFVAFRRIEETSEKGQRRGDRRRGWWENS
jgi:hypothetical protein